MNIDSLSKNRMFILTKPDFGLHLTLEIFFRGYSLLDQNADVTIPNYGGLGPTNSISKISLFKHRKLQGTKLSMA